MTPEETRYVVDRVDTRLKAEADERFAMFKLLVKAAGMRVM